MRGARAGGLALATFHAAKRGPRENVAAPPSPSRPRSRLVLLLTGSLRHLRGGLAKVTRLRLRSCPAVIRLPISSQSIWGLLNDTSARYQRRKRSEQQRDAKRESGGCLALRRRLPR